LPLSSRRLVTAELKAKPEAGLIAAQSEGRSWICVRGRVDTAPDDDRINRYEILSQLNDVRSNLPCTNNILSHIALAVVSELCSAA